MPERQVEIALVDARETVRTHLRSGNSCAPTSWRDIEPQLTEFYASPQQKPGGWVSDICGPQEILPIHTLAFLDHQPLRAVAAAVLRRAQAKAVTWITVR